MPRMVDFVCGGCETRVPDIMCDPDATRACPTCGMAMAQDWLPRSLRARAQWSDADAVVVFRNPRTGQVRYPGRNDAKCPAGYERVAMRSLHEVEHFEKANNVRNEMVWYDKGSGRGFDTHFRDEVLNH